MQTHPISHHGQPCYYFNSTDDAPNNMPMQNLFTLTPDSQIFHNSHSAFSPQHLSLINPSTSSPSFCPSYLLRPDSPLQYPFNTEAADHDHDIDPIESYVDNQEPNELNLLQNDPLTLSEPMQMPQHELYPSYPSYPLYAYLSNQMISVPLNDSYDPSASASWSAIPSASVTLSPTITALLPSNTASSLSPSDVSSNANNNNNNNTLAPPPPLFMAAAPPPPPGVLLIPSLLPPLVDEHANAPNNATILSVYNINKQVTDSNSNSSSSNIAQTLNHNPPTPQSTQCNTTSGNETPPMLTPFENNMSSNPLPPVLSIPSMPSMPSIPSIPPIPSITSISAIKQSIENQRDEEDEKEPEQPMSSEINKTKVIKKEKVKNELENITTPKQTRIKPKIRSSTKRTRKSSSRKTNKKQQKVLSNEKGKKQEDKITDQERRRIKNPKTRRKHTAIACIRCWKAKTRCSVKRPCDRCIRIGYDDCVDRPSSSRRRQNVSKKKLTKSGKKSRSKTKPKRGQKLHFDCDENHECESHAVTPRNNKNKNIHSNQNNDESPNISPHKLPQLKPKKLWSVTTSSLSEIMSGFNKEKEQENDEKNEKSVSNRMTRRALSSTISLPMNYRYTHTMPQNMIKCFEKPILSNLAPDISFNYFPAISRYQLSTKPFCDSCFGLLLNREKDLIHLQTPHNYACPNRDCHREFVEKSHLKIHLKICAELKKLSENVKEITNPQEFEEMMQLVLEPPIINYFEMVDDVLPTNKWIAQQIEWKQKHQTKRCKNTNEHKRKLSHSENDSPQTKRRKLNSNSNKH